MPETRNFWDKAMVLVYVIMVPIFAFGVYCLYISASDWLVQSGWIEHDHDTPVWIQGEWLEGEYRICEMPGSTWGALPDSAHLLCGKGDLKVQDYGWPREFADSLSDGERMQIFRGHWTGLESHFHVLPVEFWGRIDRTDRTGYSWRCQKKATILECKALN